MARSHDVSGAAFQDARQTAANDAGEQRDAADEEEDGQVEEEFVTIAGSFLEVHKGASTGTREAESPEASAGVGGIFFRPHPQAGKGIGAVSEELRWRLERREVKA